MTFEVALTKDHLERLARTQPLTGVIELVWNAFDADATEIKIEFGRNALDGIEEIRVIDNGHGILPADVERSFGALGGSWKAARSTSPEGRALHGRDGQGRYKAAGIGNRIIWRTVAADPAQGSRHVRTDIELRFSDLVHGETTDPELTDEPTGTRVLIPDLGVNPPEGLGGSGPIDRLTTTFALQLQNYNAHLTYGGQEVDPAEAQVQRVDIPLPTDKDDALLTVIEWNRRLERALYLCDSKGTPLSEQAPGIQAPGFNFTAYLQWTGFEGVDEVDLAMSHLDSGEKKQLIDAAKDAMRAHFKQRLTDETREQMNRWRAEDTYPYLGDAKDETERTVREVFDVVALSASSVVNQSDVRARRLSLRLLREAIEQDPGSLRHVLSEVIELPQEQLDELSVILGHTPLSGLIQMSKEVSNRLEFLRGLEEMVLNDLDLRKHLKERTQLHRILASETWIFGEEFGLTVDDEGLSTVLQRHVEILGRPVLAEDLEPVTDLEGHTRIVDLMLSRSVGQARNKREHLVVELKRPSVNIGDDEGAQIKKYAGAVAGDPRFNSSDVQWDFIVVGTDVIGTTDLERRESRDRPFGQIMSTTNIRVWAFSWGEIIEDALHRLKFVQSHLGYQPSAEQAIAYVRATHAKYLPPVTISPIEDDREDSRSRGSNPGPRPPESPDPPF